MMHARWIAMRAAWALLAAVVAGVAVPASAQQAADGAKKELVARVLKLQQAGLEQLGRALAEAPAQQMVAQARAALQRAPAEKRDAVARELDAEVRKYLDETVPLVRERAVALAPSTVAPLLEQRFTEDELRQIIAILESPVNAKFQQLAPEMQRALGDRLVAETRGLVEPKAQALRRAMTARIEAAVPKGN
jgi:signal transduction histidine kinase